MKSWSFRLSNFGERKLLPPFNQFLQSDNLQILATQSRSINNNNNKKGKKEKKMNFNELNALMNR
jgi:hypothetical protein